MEGAYFQGLDHHANPLGLNLLYAWCKFFLYSIEVFFVHEKIFYLQCNYFKIISLIFNFPFIKPIQPSFGKWVDSLTILAWVKKSRLGRFFGFFGFFVREKCNDYGLGMIFCLVQLKQPILSYMTILTPTHLPKQV